MDYKGGLKVQALYLEAEGLPTEARSEFLDQTCGGDAALRAEIESMLRGDSETRAATESEPPTVPGKSEAKELPPGTRLGPWRVERPVGRGGMGEVYEAQRADGTFELRAAVKLLKRGLDTDAVVARFNRERRILAQLDHPNIARVLDAGVVPDGRPFLVMEYVEGQPITEYVRGRDLPAAELLRLMITVCEAVQAAHAKKIVHRDLKPSNVLVTPQGQVKLLDFGIAKAVAEEDESEATRLSGGSALTPAYAAPEQLLGLPAAPATDVYALGCILYQLLVERLPHARSGRTTSDIARGLDKETIERPSTVLRKERGRLPEPLRLARLKSASKDLDHVVLKALHAEAQRRYPSAQDLGRDLQRLLEHRPVLARSDSIAYRVGRFVRRNRVLVAATAAVVLALAAGLAAALWQARAALVARNDATHRREQADGLINFMLGDLSDQLEQIGRLSILDSTITKVMGYMSSQPVASLDDEALTQRVRALIEIGNIQSQRGRTPESDRAIQEAIESAQNLLARHPGSVEIESLLATALRSRAYSYTFARQYPHILGDDLEATRLLDDVLRKRSNDKEARRAMVDVAFSLWRLGDSYPVAAGNPAVVSARELALSDARILADAADASPADVQTYIIIYEPIVREQAIHQGSAAALNAYQDLMARITAGIKRFPDYMSMLDTATQIGGQATSVFTRQGRFREAHEASRMGLDSGRRLVSFDPSNVDWKRSLAYTLQYSADLAASEAQWQTSEQLAQESVQLLDKALHDGVGGDVVFCSAGGYQTLGLAQAQLGKLAQAASSWNSAIALSEKEKDSHYAQLRVISSRLLLWEFNGISPDERTKLQEALDGFRQIRPSLSLPERNVLKNREMSFAYLSGDPKTGEAIYGELSDADYVAIRATTETRRRLCARLAKQAGPQCGKVHEWAPPS